MTARDHLIVGWIYFVAAWLSLVVINGIITFMLTPGPVAGNRRLLGRLLQPDLLAVARAAHRRLRHAGRAVRPAGRLPATRPASFKAAIVRYTAALGLGRPGRRPSASIFWYWKAIPARRSSNGGRQIMPTPHRA